MCDEPLTLVEVFAHQGRLRGGQLHKTSTDVLKLLTVRRLLLPDARLVLAMAGDEAARSLTGWRRVAAREWGVDIVVVRIPDEARAGIAAAQVRQQMVNPGNAGPMGEQ